MKVLFLHPTPNLGLSVLIPIPLIVISFIVKVKIVVRLYVYLHTNNYADKEMFHIQHEDSTKLFSCFL
jgi:hypothetical protein